MPGRAVNICLLGASFETGNMGVSALAASLVGILTELQPQARITLLVCHHEATDRVISLGGRDVSIKSLPIRRSPLAHLGNNVFFVSFLSHVACFRPLRALALRISPLLRAIDTADFIGDIHAGDSFSDIYGFIRFWESCRPLLWVLRLGKPLYMLPQTYGPFARKGAVVLARHILNRAKFISARDKESAALAASLSGKQDIPVVPDVAFCLTPSIPVGNFQEIELLKNNRPILGMNVSGLLFNGGYTRNNMFHLKLDYPSFCLSLAKEILECCEYSVLLVPHTIAAPSSVEDDLSASRAIQSELASLYPGRIAVSEEIYDQCELKELIGRCSFFIGARMHSCIAALSLGIPTIGVAYSRKFSGVFRVAGMNDWVLPATEMDNNEAVAFAMDRIRKADDVREPLGINAGRMRSDIFELFSRIGEALDA